MKIVYVVESMDLSGGVKDIVEQASGLARRGHDVAIVTRMAEHAWIRVDVPVIAVERFDASTLPEADVHVATWFPTVVPTVRARRAPRVFHFCQGYEAIYPNTLERMDEIREAYGQPIPKLLLSAHLAEILSPRYPGEMLTVGPAIRVDDYAPADPGRTARREPAVVGVVGPFGYDLKGIDVALRAVARLRARGMAVTLHRASQLALEEAETRIAAAEVYRHRASVSEMIALYHGLDLLIHPSADAEGLGLPPFEAIAAGVPVVITDIPSLRVLPDEAVSRVPVRDDAAMADAAERLLRDGALWGERRRKGLEAVREFSLEKALDRLEGFFSR